MNSLIGIGRVLETVMSTTYKKNIFFTSLTDLLGVQKRSLPAMKYNPRTCDDTALIFGAKIWEETFEFK